VLVVVLLWRPAQGPSVALNTNWYHGENMRWFAESRDQPHNGVSIVGQVLNAEYFTDTFTQLYDAGIHKLHK
jgi:hypothetical protein